MINLPLYISQCLIKSLSNILIEISLNTHIIEEFESKIRLDQGKLNLNSWAFQTLIHILEYETVGHLLPPYYALEYKTVGHINP